MYLLKKYYTYYLLKNFQYAEYELLMSGSLNGISKIKLLINNIQIYFENQVILCIETLLKYLKKFNYLLGFLNRLFKDSILGNLIKFKIIGRGYKMFSTKSQFILRLGYAENKIIDKKINFLLKKKKKKEYKIYKSSIFFKKRSDDFKRIFRKK